MKKLKSTIIDKNVKTIEPYFYIYKFSYFHSQVAIYVCNLSFAIKKCPLQLILVCKLVAKDMISQNIVPSSPNIVYQNEVKNEENVICEKGDSRSNVE